MIEAILMMGGLGLIVGAGLAAASKIFYVYVDPLIVAVDEALPGANCGGCGYPGCSSNAEAIVAGKSPPNSCVAAGPEVAEEIAAILGVVIEAKEPDIARPGCTYGVADADVKYIYDGLADCRAAALINGGMKVCHIGCLGLGTCARACPFDAITMGPEGLPVVDESRCTGCGTCERVCPKHIITLSSVTRRIIREYTTDDCTTPCQRACPAGIDICEYIQQIERGDFHRAVQVIKERNPFPTLIGRICPRPCEDDCRRGLIDEPVAINFLKRFAADFEKENSHRIQPYKAPETGRKIAVVGGGVEGLSTAFFSARLGHSPTVFESTHQLGGLLRSAIAAYRLPADILDWDIKGVIEMGVAAETGKALGKDITVNGLLQEGYKAVFTALGGYDSRLARNEGRPAPPPIPGMQLLIDFMKTPPVVGDLPGDVVIAGGDPLAVEAALACKKQGCRNVTLILRDAENTADLDEKTRQSLQDSGVPALFQTAVRRLLGAEDDLKALEIVDLSSLETRTISAALLIISAGRFPEMIFSRPDVAEKNAEDGEGEQAAADGRWIGRLSRQTPDRVDAPGMLGSGAVLSDYSGAIKAIAGGRRAAASLHQIMLGMEPALPDNLLNSRSIIQNVDHVEHVAPVPRTIMPLSIPREIAGGAEIEKGFSPEDAAAEAKRCLQCGLICYQRTEAENA